MERVGRRGRKVLELIKKNVSMSLKYSHYIRELYMMTTMEVVMMKTRIVMMINDDEGDDDDDPVWPFPNIH